jgi:hypothetical protein
MVLRKKAFSNAPYFLGSGKVPHCFKNEQKWKNYLHSEFVNPIASPNRMGMSIDESWHYTFAFQVNNAIKGNLCISVFDLRIATQIQNTTSTAKWKNIV